MDVLIHIGIKIDKDNDNALYNVPEKSERHKENGEDGGEVCKSEGVICPRKADNLQNYFACFRNYKKEDVLKKSKLDL